MASPVEQPITFGDVLTEVEAAQYLRISYPQMHRWRKSHRIPHFRMGSRVLYRKVDLDEWTAEMVRQEMDRLASEEAAS